MPPKEAISGTPSKRRLKSTRLTDIEAAEVQWLWPNRIPLGKFTLLQGDPSLGKSTLAFDIAARVSCGRPWPDRADCPAPLGDVFIFSAEDGASDTIKPRLQAAGADEHRIHVVEGVEAIRADSVDSFSLEEHWPSLEQMLRESDAPRLAILDPLAAFMGQVDSNMNTDVRRILGPLAKLAERTNVAILAITHLNKSGGGKALYRASGSLGFIAAARAGMQVTKAKDDKDRRIVTVVKNNLAPPMPGLAYRLVGSPPRVVWEESPVELTADEAIAEEDAGQEDTTACEDATHWLRHALADGPLPQREVIRLGQRAGFSKRTLERAKSKAGVESRLQGFGGNWVWCLKNVQSPPSPPETAS